MSAFHLRVVRPIFVVLLLATVVSPARGQEEGQGRFQDPYVVRDEIEDIFASPEFRRLKYERSESEITESEFESTELPGWLKRTVETVGAVLGPALSIFFWVVLGLICGLIAYVAYIGIRSAQLGSPNIGGGVPEFEEGEAPHSPAELAADVYLNRAAELAAAGETRAAIGQLVLGAMSSIEREGLIRFRRGLTGRDYLRAARSREELYAALRQILGIYEPICFGRRAALREHYETSLDRYLGAFHVA